MIKKNIRNGIIGAGLTALILSGCSIDSTASTQKSSNDTSRHEEKAEQSAHKNDAQEKSKQQDQSNHKKNQEDKLQTSASGNKVTVVSNPKSNLVLVNKTHKLPDGYQPPDLTIPHVKFPYDGKYEKMHLRKPAADALEKMFNAAEKQGIILYAQSGYRSFDRQKAIFANNVQTQGKKQASIVSAQPGTSEHQTGLAMDITSQDAGFKLEQDFGDTKEGKWVAQHCADYGFIIRYPKGKDKEKITGYEYEPWHLRYVGTKAAKYIMAHHITLEEYLAKK
ncbi:LAS superfamily LD-carboxypeptidase LdcB [Scopulibacillus daqui]|uniref:LAS superfamily LD-carboxypeptidase LdcB n=1 Tax=Scopulibacillus daqui TaxID=1469162 RepID=A0ABS2PWZ2_9BACL|nr:M15 family metallopeptidase [Scopulibacillus daqui]MBM7644483.1 LAS superfamily LD-carboxypeptidase LdcB [Scopulibacillus daqui]